MKAETWLFGAGVLFFWPVAVVYGLLSGGEAVGTTSLALTGGLAVLIGLYLFITGRRVDPRPEDDPFGDVEDAAGEYGFFSPNSWMPLPLATGAAIIFLGLAVGWWLVLIGVAFSAFALVGWVFEYSRGVQSH